MLLPTSGQRLFPFWKVFDQPISLGRMYSASLLPVRQKSSHSWGIEVHYSASPQRRWVRRILGRAGSWLPTPTAKANVLAPSMSKWPAYASFQIWMSGRKLIPVWEWMMGFPEGWTDCERLGTRSCLSKSSL